MIAMLPRAEVVERAEVRLLGRSRRSYDKTIR
jgi:hypothetical protein